MYYEWPRAWPAKGARASDAWFQSISVWAFVRGLPTPLWNAMEFRCYRHGQGRNP